MTKEAKRTKDDDGDNRQAARGHKQPHLPTALVFRIVLHDVTRDSSVRLCSSLASCTEGSIRGPGHDEINAERDNGHVNDSPYNRRPAEKSPQCPNCGGATEDYPQKPFGVPQVLQCKLLSMWSLRLRTYRDSDTATSSRVAVPLPGAAL